MEEFFTYSGSAAGIIALFWMIGTQIFGTYDSKTIRELMENQSASFNRALVRIENIVKAIQQK